MHNYKLKRLFLALSLLVTNYELLVTKCFSQEQLTITTYYPSPYGSYNELRTYSNTYLATDGGNVGIGTTTSGSALEIFRSLQGGVGHLRLNNPDTAGDHRRLITFFQGATQRADLGDEPLDFYLRTIDARPITFFTNNTERVRIDSAGNVGIGTTGPDTAGLVVSKKVGSTVGVFGTTRGVSLVSDDANVGFNTYYNNVWKSISDGYTAIVWLNSSDGNINFLTGPQATAANENIQASLNTRMTITNSGRVGIGTTLPGAELHVYSKPGGIGPYPPGLYIDANTAPASGAPSTNENSFAGYIRNGFGGSGSHGALYLESESQSGFPTLRVRQFDDEFVTEIGKSMTDPIGNHQGYGVSVMGHSVSATLGYYESFPPLPGVAYAGYFDGQVNITDNTRISGGASIAGVKGLQMFYDADDTGWVVSDNGSADPLVATARLVLYGDPVQIGAGTAKNLFVTGGIVVGGPEANPGTGNILVRGDIITDVQTYPDYVFDSGYKLMPLRKLQEFIAEKKHLPNMPSAQEIKKEGVKIFEQQRMTLEKLEEAYLYIINLEERIAKLEAALRRD